MRDYTFSHCMGMDDLRRPVVVFHMSDAISVVRKISIHTKNWELRYTP